MPLLYEIDEARDERPLEPPREKTCLNCQRSEVGTVNIDAGSFVVGFCPKHECFMSEAEMNEDRRGEYCWM